MEKPTGLIAKVIDTLQLVNEVPGPYSLIEKDIILQHIRAAYLLLLNCPAVEEVDREQLSIPEITSQVVSGTNDESYVQQINELNELINQLKMEQSDSIQLFDTLKKEVEQEKLKSSNADLQIGELNKTIHAQKEEIEGILSELDQKNLMAEKIKMDYESTISDQLNTIEHLKKELEMVLLREDELEEEVSIPEQPVFHVENRDDTPIITPKVEPIVIFEEPTIQEPEIQKPIEIKQEPEKIAEKSVEIVDDILEFAHSTVIKQEIPVTPQPQQPLLFVEENAPAKTEKKSLNELLTEKKEDNSIGSKFQQAKIVDLTKAISINDKFLFIRELFKSKGEEFSTSLHRLNNCPNIEEAFNVMEELKNYYFWDTTSSAYLALCDLVRRKFL
ncbi:MAG: hypothetical protein H6Q25_495 [Bacteroidetes bacterium]|nr:hypothetical protein [Bacteroidota bacterium]